MSARYRFNVDELDEMFATLANYRVYPGGRTREERNLNLRNWAIEHGLTRPYTTDRISEVYANFLRDQNDMSDDWFSRVRYPRPPRVDNWIQRIQYPEPWEPAKPDNWIENVDYPEPLETDDWFQRIQYPETSLEIKKRREGKAGGYKFSTKELARIFKELKRYNIIPGGSTRQERNLNLRNWAIENGFTGEENIDAFNEYLFDEYRRQQNDLTDNWFDTVDYAEPALEPKSKKRYYFTMDDLDDIDKTFQEAELFLPGDTRMEKEQNLRDWLNRREYDGGRDIESIKQYVRRFKGQILAPETVEEEVPKVEVEDKTQKVREWFEKEVKPRFLDEYIVIQLEVEDMLNPGKVLYYVLNSEKQYKKIMEVLERKQFIVEPKTWGSDPVILDYPEVGYIKKYEIRVLDESTSKFDGSIKKKYYRRREARFFKYLARVSNKTILAALAKCQIFDEVTPENGEKLAETCLLYSLRQFGLPDEKLNIIAESRVVNYYVQASECKKLFAEFGLKGRIKEIGIPHGKTTRTRTLVNTGDDFLINLYKEHYFLDFNTGMTKDWVKEVVKNPETTALPNQRLAAGKWKTENSRTICSGDLVQLLMELGCFERMKYGDLDNIPVKDRLPVPIYDLNYNDEFCVRKLERKPHAKSISPMDKVVVADFETDPTKDPHIPLMVVMDFVIKHEPERFIGTDCAIQMLDDLDSYTTIYFHNSSYDLNFLMPNVRKADVIRKESRTISATLHYKNKIFYVRDFLALVNCKLEKLPEMFQLDSGAKEMFPYNYYTVERFTQNIGDIDEAAKVEAEHKKAFDVDQFRQNIEAIEGCSLGNNKFDMQKYCEFYCKQDVEILRQAFLKFGSLMYKSFGLDIRSFITAPAIANYVIQENVLRPAGISYYGGIVKFYLSKAVYGGRCMCAWNKKWHTKVPIQDFDACSLYPSAMARMFIPLGNPKVLTDEQCKDKAFLKSVDFYVVTIHISKVKRHRAFSLIPQRTKDGLEWNDHLPENGLIQEFSSIFIEDLERFYETKPGARDGIEYEVLRGYYWNEGKDYSIQPFIKEIYKKRAVFKFVKDPVQEIYKLIMNSAYGKTLQKFIETETKIVPDYEKDSFMLRNKNRVVSLLQMHSSKSWVFTLTRNIDNQFTPEHVGIIVLDMSKRIMNEVMCLAEDLGCMVFYQDTDSMHIRLSDIPKLAKNYEIMYGRPLLKGKVKVDEGLTVEQIEEKFGDQFVENEMGRFHSDFDSKKGDVLYAEESIFIRKKMYLDKLKLSNGEVDYHARMKGIPQQCIDFAANEMDGYVELYEHIYEGKPYEFDILAGKVSFKQSKDYSISTRPKFTRTAQSVYGEGKVDDYFIYGADDSDRRAEAYID